MTIFYETLSHAEKCDYLYELIKTHGLITRKNLAVKVGYSNNSVSGAFIGYQLNALLKNNSIKKIREKNTAFYYVDDIEKKKQNKAKNCCSIFINVLEKVIAAKSRRQLNEAKAEAKLLLSTKTGDNK